MSFFHPLLFSSPTPKTKTLLLLLLLSPPRLLSTSSPQETQFQSSLSRLNPNFTPADVESALRLQPDPDLALDIFRWTSLRPSYRHPPSTYHTMLQISISSGRLSAAESLVSEILSGACPPDLPLLNSSIRFCSSRRRLLSRAFELYRLMLRSSCPPSLETFTLLLALLLNRFGNPPVCHVYLRSVRSLVRQMKASGVVPDTLALNLVIKAYAICLDVDGAMRVFREMPLYGLEPNGYSYGYVVKGFCGKGLVEKGYGLFKEMRGRGFVPTSSVYMAVICSLVMEERFDEGVGVLFDMLGNSMRPDVLTYRTVFEGMCRGGRTEDAFELLEEVGRRSGAMDRKVYSDLLEGLHWLCNPQD